MNTTDAVDVFVRELRKEFHKAGKENPYFAWTLEIAEATYTTTITVRTAILGLGEPRAVVRSFKTHDIRKETAGMLALETARDMYKRARVEVTTFPYNQDT